jgi:hypothetical protein
MTPEGLTHCGVAPFKDPKIPSASNSYLYNAMIHPMIRFTIKGAIWYQGKHWINLNIILAMNCELLLGNE